MSNYYPPKVNKRFTSPEHAGEIPEADARGRWASFQCGVSVGFSLRIDPDSKKILEAKFRSNGCGFVIASADFLCEQIAGKLLTELHALEDLEADLKSYFGDFTGDRRHCADICLDALQNALAEYRLKQVAEWTGEKALICSCFGVSEEDIEAAVSENDPVTVEEVGEICHAGTGCGSCQPLIQEILDSQDGW